MGSIGAAARSDAINLRFRICHIRTSPTSNGDILHVRGGPPRLQVRFAG
jgi:hypothetical protein